MICRTENDQHQFKEDSAVRHHEKECQGGDDEKGEEPKSLWGFEAYDNEEKDQKSGREQGQPVEEPDHSWRRLVEWKIDKDPEKI